VVIAEMFRALEGDTPVPSRDGKGKRYEGGGKGGISDDRLQNGTEIRPTQGGNRGDLLLARIEPFGASDPTAHAKG